MEIRSAFAHASDDSLLLASAPNGVTWYHTVPHSGVVCPPTQRGASQGAAQQYTASTQPRYSQFIQTRMQEPGCRARMQSQGTEPVRSQYRASTEPGYRASTEPVQRQDTQPGYTARIQSQDTGGRIHNQDTEPTTIRSQYTASRQPVQSQYAASTQGSTEPVQSQYAGYAASTQPVGRQYTTSRQPVHHQPDRGPASMKIYPES